jgi:hypothetical protein
MSSSFSYNTLKNKTPKQLQKIIEESMKTDAKNKQIINDTIEHHQNKTAKRTPEAKGFQKWVKKNYKQVTEQEIIDRQMFNETYDKKMEKLQEKRSFINLIITKIEYYKTYDDLKSKLENDIDILIYNDEPPESFPSQILTFLRETPNLDQIKEKIHNVLSRINRSITELENTPNVHNQNYIKKRESEFRFGGKKRKTKSKKPKHRNISRQTTRKYHHNI